jgi:arabinogalactan oligomer/maltooligosaccharide transport system substrate-binding protein
MAKMLSAIAAHLLVLALLIVWFGRPAPAEGIPPEGLPSPQSKFTGELEPNITLRVLENDTAIKQGYFAVLLEAFNDAYAEYGIVAIDANMDQYLDLENDGPYGYGPDVIYQANDQIMKYIDGKHVQPLPFENIDCFSDVSENAWRAYTGTDGQIYGIPVNIQAPVLYYRKDMLPENWQSEWDKDQNGTPDMVENWADLYAYSLQVTSQSNREKYGYMKSLWDVYFTSGYLFSYGGYVFGNNGNDARDIGFSANDSYKGLRITRQLASVMNEDCIDDTITKKQYAKLASGEYFASMTTPDVYTLYIDELILAYQSEGMNAEEARAAAVENLVAAPVPMLPLSGDLTDRGSERIPCKMMGGINGYAISAYTKAPNAALAFINFATEYEIIMRRNELLGIVPARIDCAYAAGGLAGIVNEMVAEGNLYIMPSIRAIAQIWTPVGTLLGDVAKDPFRPPAEQKYTEDEQLKTALEGIDTQVYNAIWTLK